MKQQESGAVVLLWQERGEFSGHAGALPKGIYGLGVVPVDGEDDGLLIIGICDRRPPAKETNLRIDETDEVVLVDMMS